MNRWLGTGVAALVLLFSSCSPDESLSVRLSDLEQIPFDEGYHKATVHLSNGVDVPIMTWTPYVASTSRLPLVVVLHGAGQGGIYQGEGVLKSLFVPGFEEIPAVFVAPTGVLGHWSLDAAQEMVDALVSGILKAGWPVDPGRVILAGYSAGALGVWTTSQRHASLYRAGVAVAGDPVIHSLEETDIMPLFVIHSRMDELFPFDQVALDVESYAAAGAPVTLYPVDGVGHSAIAAYLPAARASAAWLKNLWQ